MLETSPWLMYGGSGAVLGIVLGVVLQRSRFCLVAAFGNYALMRDTRHIRALLIALGVAIAGTMLLEHGIEVPIGESVYRQPHIDWLGVGFGGLVFGIGAMLAGGCAARTLTLSAEGNLGSLLALLGFALGGALARYGWLESLRLQWAQSAMALPAADASILSLLGASSGMALGLAFLLGGLVIGAIPRGDRYLNRAAAMLGLLVVVGWALSGWLTRDAFQPQPVDSLSFAGPLARLTWFGFSGEWFGSLFPIALVIGTLLGAWGSALWGGQFRLAWPRGRSVMAYVMGGLMMGVGAAFAGACNIGHGLTGLSALSVESMAAAIAMALGMGMGLLWLSRTA